jgi:AAA ATPase domain
MSKFFNTAGPCKTDRHYMLPPERRLPGVRELIDQELYFVVHAPRQVGKTTCFRALARDLTSEGRYAALLTTCEAGQTLEPDLDGAVAAVLDTLRQDAELELPPELRPPEVDASLPPRSRLRDLLQRWAQSSPRPVVLFLDEIDALLDEALITVLRQLRSGYPNRPRGFPQTVALIGLRDVRDYRLSVRPDGDSLGSASPFNIKVRSLTIRHFTAEEVAELYEQHTAATGQVFTDEAKALAFELTRGQPWLVNALADQIVREEASDPAVTIETEHVERAREALILRRDTHIDSLIERLREPRVQRVLEPILTGRFLSSEVLDDDVRFVKDLGLVVEGPAGLEIANPIYREVVPRALTSLLEKSLPLPRPSYKGADGRLRFDQLLDDFGVFWREHAESFLSKAPYSEAAAQLVFMAYLQKIVNAGGSIDREYAAGSGRIDLCVRWPHASGLQRWALELKVWRDGESDPAKQGSEQLGGYLERLSLDEGTLIVFDSRSTAPALPDRISTTEVEQKGRRVKLVRL